MPFFMKRYGALCCIAAMLAAGVGSQVPCVTGCADVNCDGLLDVLDVQAIAADILAYHPELNTRDVNGDGRVDVRDFQAAVAGLGQAAPSSTEPLPERSDSKAYISHQHRTEPVLVQSKTLLVVQPDRPIPRRTAVWLQCRAVGHSAERFLFHLTPNAPPSLA